MQTQILMVTGFLGAGKTTLINLLLPELLKQGKVAIIENEFGKISVDTQLLTHPDVEVRELLAGCICCTLRGKMAEALVLLMEQQKPDWIIIEPSGISQTSDALKAVMQTGLAPEQVKVVNLLDCQNFEIYAESFGGFFNDQISCAGLQILNHSQSLPEDELQAIAETVNTTNPNTILIAHGLEKMQGTQLMQLVDEMHTLNAWSDKHEHLPPALRTLETWAAEAPFAQTEDELRSKIEALTDESAGVIFRLKGFVPTRDGGRMHIEYKPGTLAITPADSPDKQGLVVIGHKLSRSRLESFFGK